MENQSNQGLIGLIFLANEYEKLKKRAVKQKKLQSDRNKRYYQRHRDAILKKNKEMRDIYKLVKRN